MEELFIQHPQPWAVDDSRPGHEGSVIVWDADGGIVFYAGDMEDCVWADILLARFIAAAPELLTALEAIEAHHVEQNRIKGRDESRSTTLRTARAALALTRPARRDGGET